MIRNAVFMILIALAFSLAAHADCVPQFQSTGGVQIQKDTLGDNSCYISIHPGSVSNMVYRDYTLADNGLFMVFNSYGEGNNSASTGSREFFFFPRTQSVAFAVDPRSGDVIVTAANGDSFYFDTRTAQLKSVGHGKVTVNPAFTPANKGGIEVTAYQGLWLDVGFALGHSPSTEAGRTVTFHSAEGLTCQVKVSDVFTNIVDNPTIKFNDADLMAYLKKTCKGW